MKSKSQLLKEVTVPQIPDGDKDMLVRKNTGMETIKFGVELPVVQYEHVKKVLIADDDPAIIDVLTMMLEAAGYTVFASGNSRTLFDVSKFCPDLVLLDILMSGISGYDVCKKLKAQESTKHIPVIMISAKKDAIQIASDACADDFIAKPFEMNKLLQKMAKYIKN